MPRGSESVDLYQYERLFWKEGGLRLCGVDEAGRGPLAGPVAVAAVILHPENLVVGLNDSKKLSPKKREVLFDLIREKAMAYAIVFVGNPVVDRLNILKATLQGMAEAVDALPKAPQMVLVDGDKKPALSKEISCRSLIGGDGLSASIAAASILAKVSRDRYMARMDHFYPGYGFGIHKGYGTEAHYDALRKKGPCPIHRRTFLKNFSPYRMGRRQLGQFGESYAAKVLEKEGFLVVKRNFTAPGGEIDLIAQKGEALFFCEVKCYGQNARYAPRAAVTSAKQKKIRKAALFYLEELPGEWEIHFSVLEILVDDQGEKGVQVRSFLPIWDAFLWENCE